MICVKRMSPEHVALVAQLEKACFSMPWSERAIAGELSNPLSLWLVALDEAGLVGYVGSQAVLGEADMMNLAVLPTKRRMGVAEKLVKRLIEILGEEGVHSLTLEVRASNCPAISLYEKLGFVTVGRRPNYYSNPKEDAWILRKEWSL